MTNDEGKSPAQIRRDFDKKFPGAAGSNSHATTQTGDNDRSDAPSGSPADTRDACAPLAADWPISESPKIPLRSVAVAGHIHNLQFKVIASNNSTLL
jgi:hypothetical protein